MNFTELFNIFKKNQHSFYFVGGCVRDFLLNRQPKDYDFTTTAKPEQIVEILQQVNCKFWTIGEKFGTIVALWEGQQIEITTHRKDMTAGRHPDVVFTDDLKTDLERRDFTINSMAADENFNIIDYFNGQQHLRDRSIVATGNAIQRFREDPLRMLRAIRFAAQLGFYLDLRTEDAVRSYNSSILTVSAERCYDELTKLLLAPDVKNGLELLYYTGLLGLLLPEVFPITMLDRTTEVHSKDLWEHTKDVVSNITNSPVSKWSALLHDIGKPATRGETSIKTVHFFGHEVVGAQLANSICRRLKMSNEMRKSIIGLILLHQRAGDAIKDGVVSHSALRRLVRDCDDNNCSISDLFDLFEADISSKDSWRLIRHNKQAELLRKELENLTKREAQPLLPSGIGNAIMERFNLQPSKEVGKIKEKLDQMLLDGKINNSMSTNEILNVYEKD